MRIAYLILAHAHPQQLGRLVARLAAPGVRCYLHIDANTDDATFARMCSAAEAAGDVRFIARRPCRWGGFSLVAATLDLLRAARADGCDWAVLLSGQDYPLKSHAQICERLASEDVAGWIDLRSARQFDVGYRWQRYHPEALNQTRRGKLLQRSQRLLQGLGWQRRLPAPLEEIRAGSQWWLLRADAIAAVLTLCAQYPQLEQFFASTLVPDEMFFQTLLWHSPLREQLRSDPLRHIEWADGAWSPRTLEPADLPTLYNSPALFARKFAPDSDCTRQLDTLLGIPDPGISC
ncbi:beta-1,6-N-acetylglucosaminyltransferase [Chitinilyticum piscinae]|uniref:Peptide O-xylosyltransferase n=1 Tax=Chitinilyticum piscinae TaxID=2866724 RepID=A0A8J7FS08_9NEIS|nr:beta-1,6-N-acetylglucosaminyltransferase [Chitinilyticum piscinae]MBE9609771.1 hypothetical protein [Chitinilyticum piscinae]